MNDKLQTAINNNHGLYQAIFNHHGVHLHIQEDIAYTEKKVPPLYSNLVTRSKGWRPDHHFTTIDGNYESENWSEWSVKDSFQALNLSRYGFEKLLDAQWIYLGRNNFTPVEPSRLQYGLIKTMEDLSSWRLAWNLDVALGKGIFNEKLLDDPKIHFVAGYDEESIVSGCLVNETDDVLGISNFFSPDKAILYWSDVITFLGALFRHKDIVGYERDSLVNELVPLGFEGIGNLRVWLKKR